MTETELEEVERRISEAGVNLTARERGNMWKRCAIDRHRNNCELQAALEAKDAEIAALQLALDKSLELQSHYAGILNMYDNGSRRQFTTVDDWLARLGSLEQSVTK